jgi:hypothetical protein
MLDFETDTLSCVRFLEYLVFFRLRELLGAKKVKTLSTYRYNDNSKVCYLAMRNMQIVA